MSPFSILHAATDPCMLTRLREVLESSARGEAISGKLV